MGIRLLGPVELRTADGSPAELAGAQRRAVLALLALQLGRTVPVERFFELLWGDQPPARARAALQGHVAALRKVLDGTPFALTTRAPGYLLTGEAHLVDARLFESLADRAEGAGHQQAAELLQRALGLWSGAPLADLPDTELRRALAGQLDEARTRVLTAWAERRLRLGSGAAAIPALEQSVRADGLREPVVALLIRCLHQAGRPSDALTAYHQARERLDSELGVAPGPALREAFAAALGDGAEPEFRARRAPLTLPAAPAPAERPARHLPRQPAGFVGRSLESHWLDRECGADRGGDGLAVVVGPAGVGKTATVIRWAHTAAAAFPDGQLFADLRGFDPAGPTDRAEVLAQFLLALGLPEAAIPEQPAARAARFRAETEHRRLLVVLDNARSSADVTGLLPAGPGCAAVVTSRNTLEDLVVTEGAALLRLEALPGTDALRLLERMLTPGRVQAEPAAAQRLTALCDHLPLALRIAASRLASRPGWTLADLVAELDDERTRLLALDTQGSVSVRTALSLTHRHLSSSASRLITLLAAHPGPEVDAFAAAALLGTEVRTARGTLGELAAYHLLTENTPGRYGRHDLIRLFGLELYAEQPAEVRRLTTARLLDYYLEAVRKAADHLEPDPKDFGPHEHPPRSVPLPFDVRAALDWFRTEEPVVRALVTAATEDGEHERAWQLAHLAGALYYGASRLTDWLSCLRAGLHAAEQTGSPSAISFQESTFANALVGVERLAEARELGRRALERTEPSDGYVHIRALFTLALVTAVSGEPEQAARLSDTAVSLAGENGPQEHLASALAYASAIKCMTGEAETGLRYARRVRRLLADHPAATIHVWAMMSEAQALQHLRRPDHSEEVWQELLTTCRQAGFLHLHAIAEQWFADFLLWQGRAEDAAAHLRSAVDLYRLHGHLADEVTARLAGIEQSLAH